MQADTVHSAKGFFTVNLAKLPEVPGHGFGAIGSHVRRHPQGGAKATDGTLLEVKPVAIEGAMGREIRVGMKKDGKAESIR
jgi:hypothetical protein